MRYALYLFTSICILCMLGCLAYFLLLAVVALATLLEGYTVLLGLLLALAGLLLTRRARNLLHERHIALATITRLTLDRQGIRTYQLQFTTQKDQMVLVELTPKNHSFYHHLRTLFLDLYHAQPVYGSRIPLSHDANAPEKDPRHLSFFTLWLGPVLLFWFSMLFFLFGIALWFSS